MTDNNEESKANIDPKIWGPGAWLMIHSVSFSYPDNPTDDDKKHYKQFYESIQYTLPCAGCRESYAKFIVTEPTILADALDNKTTLTKWLYDVHNRVNEKLGVDYGITYEDVVKKYESYRVTNEDKQKCFKNAYKKDCPIIKLSLANCFRDYANKRNVEFNPEKYTEIMKNKDCDEWTIRNKKCEEIIKDIRLSGKVVEQEGEFKGLPTINELKLISMLSSSLRKNELIELAGRLGNNIKHRYVLTK
jgi:hypothetical protein